MQQSPIYQHINKIFIGSLIWGIFYLHLFFDASRWNQTLLGGTLPFSYAVVYAIQIGFFLLLNVNLFSYTIGKKHSLFNIDRFFKVFIAVGILVVLVQTVLLYFEIPYHFGIIGYVIGRGNLMHGSVIDSVLLYALYLTATMMLIIYLASVCVYLFQIIKMNVKLPFSMIFRVLLTFVVYGYCLGFVPEGFSVWALVFSTVYVFFAFLVYIRTKYSLRALVVAVILLLLL